MKREKLFSSDEGRGFWWWLQWGELHTKLREKEISFRELLLAVADSLLD
jgi:hypothetical protein